MTFRPQVIFSLALVLLFAWVVWEARGWGFEARLFPWLIGIPTLLLALVQLSRDLAGKGVKSPESPGGGGPALDTAVVRRRTLAFFAWTLGLFLAIWLLGFPLAVPLFMLLFLLSWGEKWWLSLLYAGVTWGLFRLVFIKVLHLPFPQGQFFGWLGV